MARLIIFILLLIFLQDIACNNVSHAGENRAIANKDHQHGFVNWSFRNGIYNVQAGQLFVRSDESNPIATINKQEKGDVVFSATLVSNKEPHWAGILAKEGYKLIVNNQSGRLELSKRIDGKWKQLAHKDKYKLYARNTNKFELTICFIGNKILGIIDNSLLIEYEDILPIDKVGNYALISGWHSNIVWSDVSLSKDFNDIPIIHGETKIFTDNKLLNVTWSRNIRDDGIYFDNEEAGLIFKIKSNNGVVNNAALRFDLLDTKGNLVEQKEINLDTLTSKEVKLSVKFSPPRRGSFKVAFYAGHKSEKHVWIEDIGSFTVLPKIPGKMQFQIAHILVGILMASMQSWHLLAAKKLGIKWLRSHDGVQTAWWTRIQPEGPSSWLWPYDDVQQLADSMNFQTLGNFLWTPLWASSAAIGNSNPRTAPPKNMDYFSLFVNKVTKHYKKSINHWEVWNEPHYQGYWQGSPEDYTTLLKTAYIAIHNADKESFVLGGGGVLPNKSDWLEKMLIAGGGKYMDGFSYTLSKS